MLAHGGMVRALSLSPTVGVTRPPCRGMTVQLHWQCTRDEWQTIVDQAASATIFHTPAWTELTCATTGWDAHPLRISWPDGRQAVVPILGFPLWRGLVSAASVGAEGYGGIIATGPLSEQEQATIYRAIRRRYRDCWMTTNPFDGPAPERVGHPWEPVSPSRALRLAPLDQLRRQYSKDRLRRVRRYQAQLVTVTWWPRLVADDRSLVARLYAAECDRWQAEGLPTEDLRRPAWFTQLWRRLGNRLQMAVATVDGKIAGLELFIKQGRIATELLTIWDRRFASYQVSTALSEACFAAAYGAGCQWFDSMPAGPQAGGDRHKAGFGAEALPVGGYRQHSPLSRMLLAAQRLRTSQQGNLQRSSKATSPDGPLLPNPS